MKKSLSERVFDAVRGTRLLYFERHLTTFDGCKEARDRMIESAESALELSRSLAESPHCSQWAKQCVSELESLPDRLATLRRARAKESIVNAMKKVVLVCQAYEKQAKEPHCAGTDELNPKPNYSYTTEQLNEERHRIRFQAQTWGGKPIPIKTLRPWDLQPPKCYLRDAAIWQMLVECELMLSGWNHVCLNSAFQLRIVPPTQTPFQTTRDALHNQQSKLFKYLHERLNNYVYFNELSGETTLFRLGITDDGIISGLKRLNKRLNELSAPFDIDIEKGSNRAMLRSKATGDAG